MTTPSFLVVLLLGLATATACFALAGALDSPALAVAGTFCVASIFVAREFWAWRGAGSQWIAYVSALGLIIVGGFAAQRVFG